jgi:hypothetical protein
MSPVPVARSSAREFGRGAASAMSRRFHRRSCPYDKAMVMKS